MDVGCGAGGELAIIHSHLGGGGVKDKSVSHKRQKSCGFALVERL